MTRLRYPQFNQEEEIFIHPDRANNNLTPVDFSPSRQEKRTTKATEQRWQPQPPNTLQRLPKGGPSDDDSDDEENGDKNRLFDEGRAGQGHGGLRPNQQQQSALEPSNSEDHWKRVLGINRLMKA